MADAASPPASRAFGAVAASLVGVAVGLAAGNALEGVRPGTLPAPGIVTLGLVAFGIVLGVLALRASLVLRLLPVLILFALAGSGLTRIGFGPGLAVATAPLALWAVRVGREWRPRGSVLLILGSLVGVGIARPGLYLSRMAATLPLVAIVIALAIAGTASAFVVPGSSRPIPARFDLRAALALAGLVVVGFATAFLLGQAGLYWISPADAGGSARPLPDLGPIALLVGFALLTVGSRRGAGGQAAGGLLLVALAFGLASVSSLAILALLLGIVGLAGVLQPSLRRAERADEALPIVALLLATALGMPLAAGLVRGFTRPLLGAVPGIGTATTTSWGAVLGFYATLVLVVLLAHLAHAYEFGFAALDPDDGRDPLPILRKGLAGLRPKV